MHYVDSSLQWNCREPLSLTIFSVFWPRIVVINPTVILGLALFSWRYNSTMLLAWVRISVLLRWVWTEWWKEVMLVSISGRASPNDSTNASEWQKIWLSPKFDLCLFSKNFHSSAASDFHRKKEKRKSIRTSTSKWSPFYFTPMPFPISSEPTSGPRRVPLDFSSNKVCS